MPIMENHSESIWLKVFANKISYYVASRDRHPGSSSEQFQLLRDQLDYARNRCKGKSLPQSMS